MSSNHDCVARVTPDGELFRRARERAEALQPRQFTPTALGRRLRHHGRSSGAVRVRIIQLEKGQLPTVDADFYREAVEAVWEALTDSMKAEDVRLALAVEADQLAASSRAAARHQARLVAQQEREVARAEERVTWLRDGLRALRTAQTTAERAAREWETEVTATLEAS